MSQTQSQQSARINQKPIQTASGAPPQADSNHVHMKILVEASKLNPKISITSQDLSQKKKLLMKAIIIHTLSIIISLSKIVLNLTFFVQEKGMLVLNDIPNLFIYWISIELHELFQISLELIIAVFSYYEYQMLNSILQHRNGQVQLELRENDYDNYFTLLAGIIRKMDTFFYVYFYISLYIIIGFISIIYGTIVFTCWSALGEEKRYYETYRPVTWMLFSCYIISVVRQIVLLVFWVLTKKCNFFQQIKWYPYEENNFFANTVINFKEVDKEQVNECCICLNEFEKEEKAVSLDCHKNHMFHYDCIQTWLLQCHYCPICRESVKILKH